MDHMPALLRTLLITAAIFLPHGSALSDNRPAPSAPASERFDAMKSVPSELLKEANRGRNIFDSEGYFAFPPQVKRVWVDVGAHLLETTIVELLTTQDVGLIAIEPMPQAWRAWVDSDRLIALPIALYLERGEREFYVTKKDARSSLAKGLEGAKYAKGRETVEVLSVQVLRLEDVLARIPPKLPITYLKTDVQSLDLQVLKSGGQ